MYLLKTMNGNYWNLKRTNNGFKHVDGGVLQFVLTLSFCFLFLLSGFVSWVYFCHLTKRQTQQNIALEQQNRERLILSLKVASLESTETLHPSLYSIFPLVRQEKVAQKNIALVGYSLGQEQKALHLTNQGQPLYLGKNASLSGTLHSAAAGVRRASIGNSQNTTVGHQNFTHTTSAHHLPDLVNWMREQILYLTNPKLWTEVEEDFSNQYFNSFYQKLKIIDLDAQAVNSRLNYNGRFWIRSKTPVILKAEDKLYDVMLSAPYILIEAGFKGRIHAFASERLIVQRHVELLFPTTLWVHRNVNASKNAIALSIGSGSEIKGLIGVTEKKSTPPPSLVMAIESKALFHGSLYCQGGIENKGSIYGTVYAQDLMYRHEGVLYSNHFIEGSISGHHPSYMPIGFPFVQGTPPKKITQWLY